MADNYTLGYTSYLNGSVSEDQMKQQHPMFRSGWREAKAREEAKAQPISELRPEKVIRRDPDNLVYTYKWRDVTEAQRFPPWNILERHPQGKLALTAMRRNIDARSEEVGSFADILKMYRVQWEQLLEHGYAEGVLAVEDLKQYEYTPKELRE